MHMHTYNRFQLYVALSAGLFVFGDGMEMAAVSMLSEALRSEWGVGWGDLALLGSIIFAGYIVGNVWGGWCSDRFGRKWALMAFGLIFLFGGFCSVVSYSFIVFAISRFVTGIGEWREWENESYVCVCVRDSDRCVCVFV
jgi:MFS family permease